MNGARGLLIMIPPEPEPPKRRSFDSGTHNAGLSEKDLERMARRQQTNRRLKRERNERLREATNREPIDWRRQHVPMSDAKDPAVDLVPSSIPDEQGRISSAYRTVDVLEALRRAEAIGNRQYEGGRRFEGLFQQAALDPMKASPILRMPASTNRDVPERALAARQKLGDMVAQVGGYFSPCGGVAWQVLGLGLSLKELTDKSPGMSERTAKRMLVAALYAWEPED